MSNVIVLAGTRKLKRKIFLSQQIKIFLSIFLINLLFISSKTFGQSANLDQIRNGKLGVYSPTPLADWVNGNAGPSNAHFAEGYSIPYRVSVSGLVGNANTIHYLIIEWDTKHGNGHALDYITHYQNLDNPEGSHLTTFGHGAEVVNPTLGTSFSGAPTLFPIPAPSSDGSEVAGQPTLSRNNLPGTTGNADINSMAIWGGTIVSLTYVFEDAPDATTQQTETRLEIAFRSTNGSTALFAWGGHIAAEYDWGSGRGATGVSGSPYHTRLIAIDGKPGNQDRSLKATAVIIPPPVCGISPAQLACPETASLSFSATGSSTGSNVSYEWTLTNGSSSAGAKIDGSNTGFTISVVPIGADFIAGGTFNLSLTVSKTGAESTTCTKVPAGTIVKVIASASANPTTIDITSAAHNTTLTADIGAGSNDLNNANYDYQWVIVTFGTLGSLTNATSRIATYTADVADPSNIEFRVTATQKNPPYCADDAMVSVAVSSGSPCIVSAQQPVCQGTITTHNGSPNPKPANATYAWSLEAYGGGGTTTATLVGGNSAGVTQQVNANESYRIVLSQTYANPALNTSCFKDVSVVPTPTVSAIYNPPGCTENTFSIDVPNSVVGSSYKVTQGGEVSPTYNQTKAGTGGTLNFSGLAAGGGFLVRVTTGTATCTATTDCASSTNSCSSESNIVQSKITSDNNIVTTKEPTIAKSVESYKIVLESPTKARVAPNPYADRIKFNLVSGVSGIGILELYTMSGQKVAVVFEGYVQAGREFTKEYLVPGEQRTNLIYVFRVGDQRVSGKLIGIK